MENYITISHLNDFIFCPKFKQEDSVIIFHLSKQCKQYMFGYAKNENEEIIVID